MTTTRLREPCSKGRGTNIGVEEQTDEWQTGVVKENFCLRPGGPADAHDEDVSPRSRCDKAAHCSNTVSRSDELMPEQSMFSTSVDAT